MSFKVGNQVQLLRHPELGPAIETRILEGWVLVGYEGTKDWWHIPERVVRADPEHDQQPIETDPVAGRSGWLTALEEELQDVIENCTDRGGGDALTTMPTELALDLLRAIGGT